MEEFTHTTEPNIHLRCLLFYRMIIDMSPDPPVTSLMASLAASQQGEEET